MRSIVTMTVTFALAGLLAAAAVGATPPKGGLFTGHESSCTSTAGQPGLTCKFEFRVSKNGQTMRLVSKHDVVGTYGCPGGGGFAVFGSHKWGPHDSGTGEPVPVINISSKGTFSGTDHFFTGSGKYRTKTTLTAKGKFTGSGKTAELEFSSGKCVSGPLKLTAH